jgi:hypothetical protein
MASENEKQVIKCPYCSEEILASAKKCKHCGEWLDRTDQQQLAIAASQASSAPAVGTLGRASGNNSQREHKIIDAVETKRRQRPRYGAGLIGGFLAGFVGYMLISMMAATPQMWALWIGWVVFGFIFLRSGWPTVWFSLSVLSFLMPVAVLVFGASTSVTYTSDAERAGAAVGTALATGTAGVVGFFFGIMFAIMAFFTRRR